MNWRSLASPPGLLLLALVAPSAAALAVEPVEPIEIRRVTTPIVIDGDLSDPAWKEVPPITTWFETNHTDNTVANPKSTAWLAYDDHFLYAAFDFEDPDPKRIKAPFGDHDQVPSYTDYGGVIINPKNDGKVAQMFLANPNGVQYDAVSSDATGEDNSVDWFWDAAGKINDHGWTLEIRIPFSSLRYSDPNPAQWRILLYRNRARDFRYQYFTSKLPRDVNCFICNSRPLVGLSGLPAGGHWILAPYVSATRTEKPEGDLGTPLRAEATKSEAGADAKWIPNPDTVVDATLNPDFSQIESDAAQISANARFALFYPEKRPFFLESTDLFSTPIQAVYTRTFTEPSFGLRATGGGENDRYTVLAGEDRGGGSVVIPGPYSSEFAPQDLSSLVSIARYRHEIGRSFVSVLYSGRETEGGAYNRVFGPDFEWRPTPQDQIAGQILASSTKTPDRPDLASEWDGRSLTGDAERAFWSHGTATWDWFVSGAHYSDGFRADNGFVPQVGYSDEYLEVGRTFRPVDFPISRLRLFTFTEQQNDETGRLLYRQITPGFGFDATGNSTARLEIHFEQVATPTATFSRFQVKPTYEISPGGIVSDVTVSAVLGDEVDFVGSRKGKGWTASISMDLRPTDHLYLNPTASRQVLDVDLPGGGRSRLFSADVARLKALYTFNSRVWLRAIGQWIGTRRDPALFSDPVTKRDGDLSGSLVFAYKLNWQSVAYLGFGDERTLDERDQLTPSARQIFLKLSYAFQH